MAKQNRELNKFPKMLNMIVTELLHEKRVDISLISKEMSDEKFDFSTASLFFWAENLLGTGVVYKQYLDDNFEDEEAAYIDIKYYVEKVFLDEHIQNYKKELLYAL